MKTLRPLQNLRKCIICENFLFGRSDKVFCDIQCKNKYHSELARSQKTIAKETYKILIKNWTIITTLLGAGADKLNINKIELARHGFDFTSVTSVEIKYKRLHFSVFEYTWHYTSNNEISISTNKEQAPISPFIFKRWRDRYNQNEFPTSFAELNHSYQRSNST